MQNATGTHEATTVVDLSGLRGDIAAAIAEAVNGTVGELPEGEVAPDADILVVLGAPQETGGEDT